ncbi:16S rRNA (guanine(966)-N(2))-methyltransferase RsmD [Leptolyngbya sp. 7M]|uniref:16S rRNA (guanine(966)-N(2))-methyltransferase RsmD n=1 Tax=Leptolyngbya sp. 7M TaxID=2812896 RepID=UPI001B8DA6DB|nr:16S rRNA (guanine(966)-N(2))-methyltransferase RsmD [Leptolyngbya sp. 7M]QYO66987.1 16S rRNA (guanine(966)-N(2))-methyltransferase RsmD [Leptolyngbya sp. 7M]
MRVIGGTYGGRILKSPPDKRTRPTSDRLRETLFNILATQINETTRFLDLCAGTGAIGIEAVSRGAEHATFVDRSRKACALVEENLDSLNIPEEKTEIHALSAENFCGREHRYGWDIVFYDPPYETDYTVVLLEFALPESRLLNKSGILIAEHHSKNALPDAIGHLRRWRILKQGETSLSFFERS